MNYLHEVLGFDASIRPWPATETLPAYLRGGKKYSIMQIENTACLLIEVDSSTFHLQNWLKQMKKLPSEPAYYVLCFPHLEPRQRKALIEARIPFIVPKSQIYMPFIGTLLQERTRATVSMPEKLSPSGQAVLLYLIAESGKNELRKVDLARLLGIQAMTVTRAVRELEMLRMVKSRREGRSDYVELAMPRKNLYKSLRPYLIDPVQRRSYVADTADYSHLPLAGETALSERSMLSAPAIPCRAISKQEYKRIAKNDFIDPLWSNGNCLELEVWKYDPQLLAHDGIVDAISLAASLAHANDERVEQAVEDMLEEEKLWCRD